MNPIDVDAESRIGEFFEILDQIQERVKEEEFETFVTQNLDKDQIQNIYQEALNNSNSENVQDLVEDIADWATRISSKMDQGTSPESFALISKVEKLFSNLYKIHNDRPLESVSKKQKVEENFPKKASRILKCREFSKDIVEGNVNEFFEHVFEKVLDYFKYNDCIEPFNVQEIYELLFEEDAIKEISHKKLQETELDPINPEAVHVVASLYACLNTFQKENKTIQEVQKAVQNYVNTQDSNISNLVYNPGQVVELKNEATEGEQNAIDLLEKFNTFEERLKEYPITLPFSDGLTNPCFMRDDKRQIKWAFKIIEKNKLMSKAEKLASLVNYHHQFPIPWTISLKIGENKGSAQFYLEGMEKIADLPDNANINTEKLHAIAIFDILFGNCDRNSSNLLAKNMGDEYEIFGIDHDQIMLCQENERGSPLRQEYLAFKEMDEQLLPQIKELFDSERVEKYKKIMEKANIEQIMYEWTEKAAKKITELADKKHSIREIVVELQKYWRNEVLADFD